MSNSGLFEAHKKEDCEAHTTRLMGAWLEKLTDRWVAHVQALIEKLRDEPLEARRYQDPRDQDPDYGRKLRELEGQIRDIDREQQGLRGPNINHTEGGGRESSWKDWVLGLVGLAIVAWLGRLSMQMDDLLSMRGEQKMMEEHLKSTDNHVERLENHVFRGSP